ncbi:MAG: NUDIX hydrolase [Thermoleophilia bacterium]|nr:NUDIX hydrolase [Thermoleophilia bacterium]
MRVHVEVAVFTVRDGRLQVLLARRSGGIWILPGAVPADDGGLDHAAHCALETGAGLRGVAMEQLYTFDGDGHEVAVAYLALIDWSRHPLSPGPDVVEVRWFPFDDLPTMGKGESAVVGYGLARLRAKTTYAPVAVNLLPDLFTLGEIQTVYEVLLGRRLDSRNFRRDVLGAGVVADSGHVRSEGRGRPARLYSSAGGHFAVDARERRAARAISSGDDPPQ